MLKVKGNSMTSAAIADGDLVIVRQQPVAENGDIVAAQLDGTGTTEATVKSLRGSTVTLGSCPQPGLSAAHRQ